LPAEQEPAAARGRAVVVGEVAVVEEPWRARMLVLGAVTQLCAAREPSERSSQRRKNAAACPKTKSTSPSIRQRSR
jgi:hypothetical protein